MTSTLDPSHIVAQATTDVRASLTKSRSSDEKIMDEKKAASADDVEVVAVEQDGDVIRESDYTDEQYKKLLRKIDRYLLPLMWFCYGIQQTDKTSLGTQAIFGLREDTGLVGQQYSWLTTIFYIAYLCGEFPSNFLLQRWALGRSLSMYMLCWGACGSIQSSFQPIGFLVTDITRHLRYLRRGCEELVSAHGHQSAPGFLRMHHLPGLRPRCRFVVQARGALLARAVLAVGQCWVWYYCQPGYVRHWLPCGEVWRPRSLALHFAFLGLVDYRACAHLLCAARKPEGG